MIGGEWATPSSPLIKYISPSAADQSGFWVGLIQDDSFGGLTELALTRPRAITGWGA
jgi:hypothetical protein